MTIPNSCKNTSPSEISYRGLSSLPSLHSLGTQQVPTRSNQIASILSAAIPQALFDNDRTSELTSRKVATHLEIIDEVLAILAMDDLVSVSYPSP